jgi:UDP-N-acetylglucosamine 2-epimerase (non-hydrolysing)
MPKNYQKVVNMNQPMIMTIFGTRPEAIKMAPILLELGQHSNISSCVVVTAQHRSMLDQVLNVFQINPAYDLDIMQPGQSLTDITVRTLQSLERIIRRAKPDMILVQGDTTTAFIGGLAAFYHQIPIGHVESGLRTQDKYNPYPEEINRHFLGVLADLCFAPTATARQALLVEGVPEERILVTGNTVIDALLMAIDQEHEFTVPALRQIDFGLPRKTLLVTAHRRESHGAPLENICHDLRDLLLARDDLQLIFPVHLNPRVRDTVFSILGGLERAFLVEPLDYPDFIQLMKCADIIVTDSGGIQEEAPALGKPVLVIRATTERPEAIEAGTARLVGTERYSIVSAVSHLLDNPASYERMQQAANPYGDGRAAQRIVDSVRYFFGLLPDRPAPFTPTRRSSSFLFESETAPSQTGDLGEPQSERLGSEWDYQRKVESYAGR